MILGLLGLALAEPVGEDAADALDARALALLDGPAGCWELVGIARWDWQLSRFGENRGEAVFAGRLEDGVWQAFHLVPTGEVRQRGKDPATLRYQAEDRFRPLVGELAGDRVSSGAVESDDPPVNALDSVFDELSTNVWTSEVEADGSGARVIRRVTIDGGAEALLTASFPSLEGPATRVDLDIPKGFHPKETPLGTRVAPGAMARIEGEVRDGVLLPTAERFVFTVTWMGLSFEGEQDLRYTKVTRCP